MLEPKTWPLLPGWMLAPLVAFFERYVFADWAFIVNLAVIVAVDTVLGVLLAVRRRELSSEGFSRVLLKLVVYMLLLIATHTVTTYKVRDEVDSLLVWVDSMVYATIMVRELLSIFEKTSLLGIFSPPRWLLRHLDRFDESGNPRP